MALNLQRFIPMKKNRLIFIFQTTIFIFSLNLHGVPSNKSEEQPRAIKQLKNKFDFEKDYQSQLEKFEMGLKNNDIKEVEKAALGLIKISANKVDKKTAAKASFTLASNYFKGVKDDYAKALEFFLKTGNLASEEDDFRLAEGAKNEYEQLEKMLKRLDDLVENQNYNDYMKAAAIYSSNYFRNYDMAIVIYDLVEYKFPNMLSEILYAKAYTYMSDDPKIRNLQKAQEIFGSIIKNYKDFNLYPDVAYLMALAKSQIIEEGIGEIKDEQKGINIKEALDLLEIAEKSFNESIKNKKRRVEPEFIALIEKTRQNLLAQSKILQGIK